MGTTVITGGSRGIGAALVEAFAADGDTVVACARDAEALAAVADRAGGRVETLRADVRDEYDVERLMERAARVGGDIDVVVANAAVFHGAPGETPLPEESYARVDDTLRTNVRGVYTTIREALPHMATDGRVLVPSGSVAREAKPGMGSYAVSKAAAEALARGFAADLTQAVGVVDPGYVATDLSGGTGRAPADVAPMFLWAARDCPDDALDGEVVDLRAWKAATR